MIKLYQLRKPTTLTLTKRPSTKIKSPYVSDGTRGNQTYTIHTPALNMGGHALKEQKLFAINRMKHQKQITYQML